MKPYVENRERKQETKKQPHKSVDDISVDFPDSEKPFDLFVKGITASPQNWFGLDSDSVDIEKVPLVLRPVKDFRLKRIL